MNLNIRSRIRLCEAMGWKNESGGGRNWVHPDIDCSRCFVNQLPDPYTSADDDYAILDAIRHGNIRELEQEQISYFYDLVQEDPVNYLIGDYARAALKVLT